MKPSLLNNVAVDQSTSMGLQAAGVQAVTVTAVLPCLYLQSTSMIQLLHQISTAGSVYSAQQRSPSSVLALLLC
jgi:hypothetical protein